MAQQTVQQQTTPKKQQPKSKVYLLHSDLLRKDSRHPDAQVVVGNVVFRHDSVYMYCDSAYYYDQISSFEAFSNVKMNQEIPCSCMVTGFTMTDIRRLPKCV